MCMQTIVPSSEHADQKGSQWSEWKLGSLSFAGFSEKETAWHPSSREPSDLVRHRLRVPDRHQPERDEASRIGAAPFLDVPVVVGLQDRKAEIAVVGRPCEQLAAEVRERREAHRADHTVRVHVADPLVDVEATDADLVERGRLDPVLLNGSADYGVEADVGGVHPAEAPDLGAVVSAEHLRCLVGEPLRQAALEHVGRLHDVIVHAHEHHVLDKHGVLRIPSAYSLGVIPSAKAPFPDSRGAVPTV